MEKETSRGGRGREGGDGREVGEAAGGSGRNLVKGMGMLAAVIRSVEDGVEDLGV